MVQKWVKDVNLLWKTRADGSVKDKRRLGLSVNRCPFPPLFSTPLFLAHLSMATAGRLRVCLDVVCMNAGTCASASALVLMKPKWWRPHYVEIIDTHTCVCECVCVHVKAHACRSRRVLQEEGTAWRSPATATRPTTCSGIRLRGLHASQWKRTTTRMPNTPTKSESDDRGSVWRTGAEKHPQPQTRKYDIFYIHTNIITHSCWVENAQTPRLGFI